MERKMINYIMKNNKVFIGLEDSKRTWKISCRCDSREIHYTAMEARYSTLHQYLRNKFPECEITVIYEAGFKGFGLHDLLTADGYKCIVTPPNKVTQEKCSSVKTDKIDARRLATVLEKGDYKVCSVPDKERREDRQLSRALVQVQTEIQRTKNRIRKFFDFHGFAEDFVAGKWTEKHYLEAQDKELSGMLKNVLDVYYELLGKLKEIRKRLHKQLMELTKKERYRNAVTLIDSVAGVGKLTAIRLVLEWGEDISKRFKSGKSLACFSGLTQSEYSTGETIHKGSITRQGRGCIRAWVIQCAWMCIKKDPAMNEAFLRISSNTGSKKKAIVAIARKMVVRMWTCLDNNIEYCIGTVQ